MIPRVNHELRLVWRDREDTRRVYECAGCGRRLRVVAPVVFPDYEARYEKLLGEAAAEPCPGRAPPVGTDDGAACARAA